MRQLSLFAAVALLAPVARAAEPTDIADVFPAGTLAFAEIHKPADLAPQLAALLKGTPLEDSLAFIHNRRDKTTNLQDVQGKPELALLGLLASPEALAELKKVRGVGVGLVGFTDLGEPEVALAVLTADTPALGVAARAFLTMDGTTRKVGAVGPVPVYQFRNPSISYDNNGQPKLSNDKPPVEGPHEPTFAYTPGLFVVGTSKKAVGEVVTRFRGEGKDSLLGTPLFKEMSAAHRQSGVYFFVNAPEFGAKYETAMKKTNRVAADSYAWVKMLANGKALRSVAGTIGLRDGGVAVQLAGAFDPAVKSPLLDFLAVPGVKVELLHHAPRPATFAAAVTLPAANRSTVVLAFLDALAKANGEIGRLPGEAVKELDAKYKRSIGFAMLDKTRAVTLVAPARQEIPKGTTPLPMLVLHMDDVTGATAWESFAPQLFADLGKSDPPPQPASETINGVKVFSLPAAGLPWKGPVHYARKDAVFAVGLDRRLVAQAALGDVGGSVAGGSQPLVSPTGPAAVLLGSVSLGEALRVLTESSVPEGPVVPLPDAPQPQGSGPQQALPSQKTVEELATARRGFFSSFDALPPATLTARRAGNELRIELFQPKVQAGLTPIITAGVAWFDKVADAGLQGGSYPPGFGRRRGVIELNWGKPGEP